MLRFRSLPGHTLGRGWPEVSFPPVYPAASKALLLAPQKWKQPRGSLGEQ